MIQDSEPILFKSIPEYYYDERDGLKNHTERIYDVNDIRHQKLLTQMRNNQYGQIKLVLVRDGIVCPAEHFIREIQHVCLWNGIIITTWKH